MQVVHFDDVSQFCAVTKDYLLQDEAHHNLILGLTGLLIQQPERFTELPYLALVEAQGQILAVALRTPPNKLVVSRALNAEALSLIAQDLLKRFVQLPAVHGPNQEAQTFASAWQSLTGQIPEQGERLRIYQLDQVQPITKVPGYLRCATEADRDLLLNWCKTLFEVLNEPISPQIKQLVDRGLKNQSIWLWQNEVPVSMASKGFTTPNGATINLVYTPPEHRRQGYASSCVAALSQFLLDSGRRHCFLFADLANPTSNHIYQTIGYQPVCDVIDYWFQR
ncbi:GNAT family N-acetyltransferase [Leptolyngbya sp. FACHB-261]|uniref:GNAT family N-acetyltransferase n=1 Tax=Leptolyngbya sp. FACHB-261 TaxID=2692806 RepID=UPI001684C84A|nr:GNAT family N-acetyltransferase [Leptolyngbya sp. FACHB-261]MBD2102738.1 GNAT family N-acetyltransferase [Leptolyngbya sp. FACHB-261]